MGQRGPCALSNLLLKLQSTTCVFAIRSFIRSSIYFYLSTYVKSANYSEDIPCVLNTSQKKFGDFYLTSVFDFVFIVLIIAQPIFFISYISIICRRVDGQANVWKRTGLFRTLSQNVVRFRARV